VVASEFAFLVVVFLVFGVEAFRRPPQFPEQQIKLTPVVVVLGKLAMFARYNVLQELAILTFTFHFEAAYLIKIAELVLAIFAVARLQVLFALQRL
jgi:hypothetical protein